MKVEGSILYDSWWLIRKDFGATITFMVMEKEKDEFEGDFGGAGRMEKHGIFRPIVTD